ncbi:SdiA-regulated domain-containing protein [Planctomycetota bacterium]
MSTVHSPQSTVHSPQSTVRVYLCVIGSVLFVCGHPSLSVAFDPVDISPKYYERTSTTLFGDDDQNPNDDAEYSGLAYSTHTGSAMLYTVDDETEQLTELSLAGVLGRDKTLDGVSDLEGITHVQGNQFAIVEETGGRIILFNIETALTSAGQSFDLSVAGNNQGIISTGLGGSDGPEGIAFDPVSNGFYVNEDSTIDLGDLDFYIKSFIYTYYGDANFDREFSSTDFTVVFQAGEYEDQISFNSGWDEGDWNGDRDFDSSDFTKAFQDGGYEMGPRF